MYLNKTQLIGGLQCDKQLHLRIHHPELAEPTQKPAALTGEVVERYARLEFPDGVLIERGRGLDAIADTKRAMADTDVHTIFEAGFQSEDLELFVDVLLRDGDGWVFIEIKASTKVKGEHIDDVAIQALALKQAGINVTRYELMHIDNTFVYGGEDDYRGLFKREDITEKVLNHVSAIKSDLVRLKAIAVGALPERHLGSQCKKPYLCPYIKHCESSNSDYPVAWLPRGQKVAETLIARATHKPITGRTHTTH